MARLILFNELVTKKKWLFPFLFLSAGIALYVLNPVTVTVSGVGEVETQPDSVTMTLAVASIKEDALSAQKDLENRMASVEEGLKAYGVEKKDITRSQMSVVPSYLADGKSMGFNASINLGVKMKNLARVNELITNLYSKGVVYVSQPMLAVEESSQLEEQAYLQALLEASQQAKLLAKQNRKLLKVRVAVSQTAPPAASSATTGAAEAAGGQERQNQTIGSNNTLKIAKTVSVTYKMW